MKKPRILTVGSMNMDLMMYGLEREPATGESVFCTGYKYATGGKGLNQAFAIAKQGAESYLAGRIGKDENGRIIAGKLKEAGVNTSYVVVDQEQLTGMSTMNIYREGTYFSVFAPGANQYIHPEDVRIAIEREQFDMVVMQLEMPLETVYATYELARDRGIPVFLDAGPAMNIPLERLKGIFAISPNEAETEALTGIALNTEENIEKAAKWLYRAAEPKYVILKLGSRGAYLYDGTRKKLIPGYKVNAIDSTAAGDTFGAALVVQYCRGASMEEAIRYGHAAAAICVTREGGSSSVPTGEETAEFLEQKKRGVNENGD